MTPKQLLARAEIDGRIALRSLAFFEKCHRRFNSFAQAGEAGTAETPKGDSVHEHAVAKRCAHD